MREKLVIVMELVVLFPYLSSRGLHNLTSKIQTLVGHPILFMVHK